MKMKLNLLLMIIMSWRKSSAYYRVWDVLTCCISMFQSGLMSAYIIKTLYFGRYEETLQKCCPIFHLCVYQLYILKLVYSRFISYLYDPVN